LVANINELALPCTAIHYQESIKIHANECGLYLKFSSVEKIHAFSAVTSLIFYALQVNCALLCDSSLLIMSAKR